MAEKGSATRRRILDAAWEVSDSRAADVVLAGISVRDVARAAGTSPSAVTYHFPTMRDLAIAMVDRLVETTSLAPLELVDLLLDSVERDGPLAMVRAAAEGNWDALNTPEEITYERRLARCYAATTADPDGEEVRRRLDRLTTSWIEDIAAVYGRTAERAGIQLVEPFEMTHLARALAGLSEGLLYHSMASPGTVPRSLVGDVVVALLSATVVPAPSPVALDERAVTLSGARAPAGDSTTAADLADAGSVAGLFVSGWEDVTLTQAGRGLGCSASEVANRFGTVRRLAAISFHRHLGAVDAAVDRRPGAGAAVNLADGVQELARAAVRDPHCALALAHERQSAQLAPPTEDPGHDVRALVPLGAALARPLGELVPGPPSRVTDVADLVTDTVLTYGATHTRRPLSSISEMALRLVPGL